MEKNLCQHLLVANVLAQVGLVEHHQCGRVRLPAVLRALRRNTKAQRQVSHVVYDNALWQKKTI